MGVPTSEVGYTPAMPRREDHEVHKGHVVALGGKKYSIGIYLYQARRSKQQDFTNIYRPTHSREMLRNCFTTHISNNAASKRLLVIPWSWLTFAVFSNTMTSLVKSKKQSLNDQPLKLAVPYKNKWRWFTVVVINGRRLVLAGRHSWATLGPLSTCDTMALR